MKESVSKQLVVNIIASFVSFGVNLGIRFFLTPYIVRTLGPEAYGFIGLANDIIGYFGLITIALNSMGGRFVTISYAKGDFVSANKYYTSIFYANIFLGSFIFVVSIGVLFFLEHLLNIPNNLILDVKLLFALLSVNSVFGLVTNIYALATFIKNRLYLSSIRGIIGNFINISLILFLFGFFAPHVWYIALTGLVMNIYVVFTNIQFTNRLTPELKICFVFFDITKVWELVKSGIWNLISKLGNILGYGADLLIANIFLGATIMGTFSLTKNLPFVILSFFQMLAAVFAPIFMNLFAKEQLYDLELEVKKSIRILGFFSTIPIVFMYLWGDSFYSLWLPTQDSSLLQTLTILGTLEFCVAMPVESLWNIFTVTNKLKYSTLVMFFNNVLILVIIIISMYVLDSVESKLIVLAGTRSIIGLFRSITFLPMYGAICLNLNKFAFYRPIIKSIFSFLLILSLGFCVKKNITINSWLDLFFIGLFTLVCCVLINGFLMLKKTDQTFVLKLLRLKR